MTGVKPLIAKCKKTIGLLETNELVEEIGKEAEMLARNYAPVDTGVMESEIMLTIEKDSFTLTCATPWAVYNEFGISPTIRKAGFGDVNSPMRVVSTSGKYAFRPFMRPAMYHAAKLAPEIFDKKLVRIWK